MRATYQLAEHFPGKAERIEALLTADTRFRSLCTSYQDILEATRRRATDAVFTDRRKIEELSRTRRTLAEEIAARLY